MILWPSRHRLSLSRDFASCRTTGQTWCRRHTHTKHCSIPCVPPLTAIYVQILVAAPPLENDSNEITIQVQRPICWNYLYLFGNCPSFIVRVVIVGLCRFSVWILVFLVLVSNCISVMRNSLQCQASAYQFLGLLLVSWIVINGTNKWDEDR